MVQGEDGAGRRRGGQLVREPAQLGGAQRTAVSARPGGVEHDDPQVVDPVHMVVRLRRRFRAEQPGPERPAGVVVADGVEHRCTQAGRHRLDQVAQPLVGGQVAAVGEVAGEQQGVDRRPGGLDLLEDGTQRGI